MNPLETFEGVKTKKPFNGTINCKIKNYFERIILLTYAYQKMAKKLPDQLQDRENMTDSHKNIWHKIFTNTNN